MRRYRRESCKEILNVIIESRKSEKTKKDKEWKRKGR